MKDQKGLVVSRLTITITIVAFLFLIAQLNDTQNQLAQNITNGGITSVRTMRPDRMMVLNSQFSGDPVIALQEASQAKDLKVITESDYQDLLKNAQLVITTNAPQVLANGATVTSSSIQSQVADGAMGYGTVQASSTVSGSDQGTLVSNSAPNDIGPGMMIAGGLDGGMMATTGPESSITVSSDGTTIESGSSVAVSTDTSSALQPIDIKVATPAESVKASTYVSYTNRQGETVVIGFDASGSPLFKSVFKK